MIDLRYVFIDEDNIERHTLSINNEGRLYFINNTDFVKQNIIIYLNTLMKEFFYNENRGLDFIAMSDGQPGELSIYIMSALQDVRGVKNVLDCKIYHNEDRNYTIIASLETENNDYITIGYNL